MHTDEHAAPASDPGGTPDRLTQARALLRREVRVRRGRDDASGEWSVLVWDEIGRLVDGGKHLRATMVLRTHDAFAGRRPAAAVRAAAGIEMLHAAFLIHDDLVDGDTLRRGVPNVAGLARERALAAGADVAVAQRWCEAVAVLAGDLALGLAHHLLATTDLPAGPALALNETVSRTLATTVSGELGDVALELGLLPADAAGVRAVARSKTAAYSFACPLVVGALVAGASGRVGADLWAVGEQLGVAFQLVDDLREVVADRARRSDLRRGKVTSVVERARRTTGWSAVGHLWGDPAVSEAGADVLRRFLVDSGVVGASAAEARTLLAGACARAQRLPVPARRVVEDCAATVERLLDEALGGDRAAGVPGDRARAG